MKTIIIDDSKLILKTLEQIISENYPELTLLGCFDNVEDAIDCIDKNPIDLVFLDIQMPEKDGFELLEEFPDRAFQVVFITSHEEFALKAIKAGAIDYIVKPLQQKEIKQAIEKAQKNHRERYQYKPQGKMTLSYSGGKAIFDPEEIIYIQGIDNLSKVFLTNQRRFMVSKTLKYFEEILDSNRFFRVHKSYIVNLETTIEISTEDSKYIILNNGIKLPISRRNIKGLKEKLKTFSIN